MWVWLSEASLQILTHAHHARVITRRAVYLRTLCAALKFIETTRSSFTGISRSTMAILNVTTLDGLLAWVDPRQRRRLSLH